MKVQSLFSGKIRKNISKCCLLKLLFSMLSVDMVIIYNNKPPLCLGYITL